MNRFFRWILLILICISLYDIKVQLDQYSNHASAYLNGLFTDISSEDLATINRFALHTVVHPIAKSSGELQALYALVFNMLIMENRIPDPKHLSEKMGDTLPMQMDRKQLFKAADYWKKRFHANPDVQQTVHRLKSSLMRAADHYPLFDDVQILLYVDSGKNEGEFTNTIIKVLDSNPWWNHQSSYCGMKVLLKDNSIRNHAAWGLLQEGGLSFFSIASRMINPVSYNSNARLDIGWMTIKCNSLYSIVSVNVPLKQFLVSILSGLWFCVGYIVVFLILSFISRKLKKTPALNQKPDKKIQANKKANDSDMTTSSFQLSENKEKNDIIDDDLAPPKKFLFQTG